MPYTNLVVGLTGGIGSGKSTVAELFSDRGVNIIDTDKIARELTAPGLIAYKAIVEKFGKHLVMGNLHLNRKSLRREIFSNPSSKHWLEQLLHPLIREEMRKQIESSTAPYSIAVIPLLFENEPNPLITRTLVVDVPEEMQIERVMKRDMHTLEEVEVIMKSQVTREKRLANADDVIYNDKRMDHLIPQVDKLHAFYLTLLNTADAPTQ